MSCISNIKQHIIKNFLKYTYKKNKNISSIFDYAQKNPSKEIATLAALYEIFSEQEDQSRYALYQNRFLNFNLKDGDKILDMGSGHIPFPFATVLADIALTDHHVGRAGAPFKYVDNKPVFECSVEKTPFQDKEFDFVYCSHVLEHVNDPVAACKELMRIGKRGYIETPHPAKDFMFATADISNHKWGVELINNVLTFTEYSPKTLEGVGSKILMDMNCHPTTLREKAVAALDIVHASHLNTMFLWENSFDYCVRTSLK